MKIRPHGLRRDGAFTLVDSIIAMAVAAIMFGALYAGLAFGFNTIKFARENTRATQIMVEKMETIRLYTWSQINSNGFIPTTLFTVPYYSMGTTNSSLVYTGHLVIGPSGLATSYSNDMKKVTVTLRWTTGKTPRTRTMTTYVSRNGMYAYVW